jgi:serine/threonine protein phosphatase 1
VAGAGMNRVFVVGDVHGCVDELDVLLTSLALSPGDAVVFVGDYVDRGPASKEVLDLLIALRCRAEIQTTFLKGNHEDMLLSYMGLAGRYGESYLHNGGVDTLVSYGLHPLTPGPEVAAALPDDHLEFLRGLDLIHTIGPFLVTHAGIDPERPLAEQREEDLLWIRERFVSHPHPLPYTVCFGHTPRRDVLLHLPYKIGVDTGCVYGNRLSCIELRESRLFQVRRGARRIESRDLRSRFRAAGIALPVGAAARTTGSPGHRAGGDGAPGAP